MQHQEIKEVFLIFDIAYNSLRKVVSSKERAEEWVKRNGIHSVMGFYVEVHQLDGD